jgi:glucose-1-phosphate adenylyltransferase
LQYAFGGIGSNAVIDGAMIEKQARIGNEVVITLEGKPAYMEGDNYYIRDGVLVVPKKGVFRTGI